jgi:hypothetical protein
MQYTITLADGRSLKGLGKNGDNFVSKTRVDETMFKDNLSTMTVSDGETTETFKDMIFVQQMEWSDGTFYLSFRERTSTEKITAAIMANANSLTDVQVALAEVYEMMITGGAI